MMKGWTFTAEGYEGEYVSWKETETEARLDLAIMLGDVELHLVKAIEDRRVWPNGSEMPCPVCKGRTRACPRCHGVGTIRYDCRITDKPKEAERGS